MLLHPTKLQPSETRAPFFDGWQTEHVFYRCECSRCGNQIAIPFSTIRAGAWGWRERFSEIDVKAIAAFFKLGKNCKALSGGWPSISPVECPQCAAAFIFYADFDEYRNSAFRIVAQGLAERGT